MNINTESKLSKQQLSSLEKHLLNDFQHDFPLVSRPYKKIADELGTTEEIVIETLNTLQSCMNTSNRSNSRSALSKIIKTD